MKKRILSVFLCIAVLLSLAGCSGKNGSLKKNSSSKDGKEQKADKSINLLYTKADSLNPYSASTENNKNICSLIFEPLVKTDSSFKPVYRVAQSVSFAEKVCNVTIKSVVFSDGSPLTSSDVVYSYNLAKNSGGLYASHLYEVISCTAVDSQNISFTLSQYDPYFSNLLDFPIIKAGSENVTNSDGIVLPPIGCGRYVSDSEKTKLTQNPNFFGEKGVIGTINLINAPDEDSLSHYVEVGTAEMYYNDLSSGNVVRMSGSRATVNLNNFVYIGINSSNSYLSNKNMRYAISSAINRKKICSDAYYNIATVAYGYFNYALEEVKSVQSLKDKSDTQITVENLNKMGYNSKDSSGFFVDANGKRPTFKLIVNSENRSRVLAANLIANQVKSAGIEINVVEMPFDSYVSALQNGSFDLYLGEISVLPNFDMTQLVIPGGSASYGVGSDATTVDENGNEVAVQNPVRTILEGYHSGNNSISDVSGVLLTEMLQIPICYRQGLFFYKDNIKSGVVSTQGDIYYSIENYKF